MAARRAGFAVVLSQSMAGTMQKEKKRGKHHEEPCNDNKADYGVTCIYIRAPGCLLLLGSPV